MHSEVPGRPVVRLAAAADAAALSLVGAATFLEAYAHMIPGPDLVRHCAVEHAAARYAAWLADARVKVWIAETPVAAPAGYLVMVPATLPIEAPRLGDLEVLRIYVLERYQRSGLGRALMAEAVAAARGAGARRLVLGVNGENARALSFYAREGFSRISDRRFRVGESCFCDAVMGRDL